LSKEIECDTRPRSEVHEKPSVTPLRDQLYLTFSSSGSS